MVAVTQERSRWSLEAVLAALGVSHSVYFDWRARAKHDRLEDLPPVAPRLDALLPEEERAIREFALKHPKIGYRKLSG